ncbi:MAG: 2OG-Fe(II) oxygenase [Deltaproteobacteria bacterium]|nr:2OG-Fe(II) oxygenase [Deltaproteobacteria bacterium]
MKRKSAAWFDPTTWDLDALRAQFAAGAPFPHLILDDLLPAKRTQELMKSFQREPIFPHDDELYAHLASLTTPQDPPLRAFHEVLTSQPVIKALAQITGRPLVRGDGRSYAYTAGHYLLPHTDRNPMDPRAVAFIYYVGTLGKLSGGDLELYDCEEKDGYLARATPKKRIAPKPNRLVIFNVSTTSLHQVREITKGTRFSVAGWFYE